MSDKEGKNPFEELQKQLQEALRNKNIVVGPVPGGPGMRAAAGNEPAEEESAADNEALERIREFNFRPREIRDYLDRFVVKQHEAKKVLSVAICDHYNHVRQCLENPDLLEKDYQKQNIILLGPTGVGKTYLMRCIARLIGVPYVKADATKFSETGYVGYDVEDLVRDLVKMAHGNLELAQYGIIYIDEIDKIAAATDTSMGKDVSGRGVQINLLKLMEDADVNLFGPTDMMGQVQAMMEMSRGGKARKKTINTRHILFIVSGAFDKLGETVKKRIESNAIGFATGEQHAPTDDPSEYLHHVETPDFIHYGYEPEFIGRLPVRVACENLAVDDLADILQSSEGSLLQQYRMDFRGYGIDFQITPEAIHEVARRAHKEGTGARGLMTVLERTFREFKYELPSTALKSFEVTDAVVREPHEALRNLLRENQHQQREVLDGEVVAFARRFRSEHGLTLEFTREARDVLIDLSIEREKTIRSLCEETFRDFEHGLKIISRNSGQDRFEITPEIVREPDRELSRLVVASFRSDDSPET